MGSGVGSAVGAGDAVAVGAGAALDAVEAPQADRVTEQARARDRMDLFMENTHCKII